MIPETTKCITHLHEPPPSSICVKIIDKNLLKVTHDSEKRGLILDILKIFRLLVNASYIKTSRVCSSIFEINDAVDKSVTYF